MPGPAPLAAAALGPALIPVSRLATLGSARVDRKRGRVDLVIVCRGPGSCAGRLDVITRGRRIASGSIQLAAGARKRMSLVLARASRTALRAPTPRKASLSLIHGSRTALENSSLGLLTD
jgi:hypothetical protein